MTLNLALAWSLATGLALSGGLALVVIGLRRPQPALSDALARLDGVSSAPTLAHPSGGTGLGDWLHRHSRRDVTVQQRRLLELQHSTIAEHYADKFVMGLIGGALPALIGVCGYLLVGVPLSVPAVVTLAGLLLGWFLPDLRLRRGAERTRVDAGEALVTYVDLVVLERLANRSATQSLESAAQFSGHPLYVLIAGALERSKLEQRAPYGELKRLAQESSLPELADLADVMRLDETGAALADTLRARARVLRDNHLTRAKIAANEVSEQMTLYMVVPALVFGAIFLAPPLLRLLT